MKRTTFDLTKYIPAHSGIKALMIILAGCGLLGLGGSLTHADLQISSSINNVLQTIQELHVTSDGTANAPDVVKLSSQGIYIDPAVLGGPSNGVLKTNAQGYVTRALIQNTNIAPGAITNINIATGSITTGNLAFPYPPTINTGLNMSCPNPNEVMVGVQNGMPVCTIMIGTGDCGISGSVQGWTSTGGIICSTNSIQSSLSSGNGLWHLVSGSNDIFYGTFIDDQNGNVAIGLNSPTAKLHVYPSLRVDTASGAFMVSGASVGINTLSPQTNLDVSGSVRFSSYAGATIRNLTVDASGYISTTTAITNSGYWMPNGTGIYYTGGNVGIGVTNPTAKLQVNGNVQAVACNTFSDERLKKDITPLSHSLQSILALNPVSFTWKDSGKGTYGFIAQDVEKIFPELVETAGTNGLKSLQYDGLIAPLVEAFQEMHIQVSSIADQYTNNEKRIDALEQKVQSLAQQIAKMKK